MPTKINQKPKIKNTISPLALIADIHGNLPALEAALEDIARFDVTKILVAGDLTGGPQAGATAQRLLDAGAELILGNSDLNLLRLAKGEAPEAWHTAHQFASLRWACAHLEPWLLDLLLSLPDQKRVELDGLPPIRLVHGSPRSAWESLFPYPAQELDSALQEIDEALLVCGHIHQPWLARRVGKLAVNPGAICGPLNGEVGAQWGLLFWAEDGWQVQLRCVPYDLAQERAAYERSGLLAEGGPLTRAILLAIESGQDVPLQFLTHAYRSAEKAGYTGESKVLPDELWDAAAASFNWAQTGRVSRETDLSYLLRGASEK